MLKKSFVIGILLLSFNSLASDWSSTTKISEINAGYSNKAVIFSAGTVHNPANCSTHHYEANVSDANVDYILSMLLSAQARGSNVKIAVHPTKCGSSNYPLVTRIKMLN